MILIGRGLDLRASGLCRDTIDGVRREKFQEREGRSLGRTEDLISSLCGFEGAERPDATQRKGKSGGRCLAEPTERERRQQKALAPRVSGDNSLRDPPVPIPNTEVKPQHADSTWLETAR